MAKLIDLMTYFCQHYPHPDDLSVGRLTKMVYLADWRSAITRSQQMTQIPWHFDHYGPYVRRIREVAETNPEHFAIDSLNTRLGNPKKVVRLRAPRRSRVAEQAMTEDERGILDHVIRTTQDLGWGDFIKLVYSTYPILMEPRYSSLDLVELAARYKAEKELIDQRRSA